MKLKILTTSLLASALFAGLGLSPAMAQSTSTPNVDRAQQAISARIQQGLNSGHITPSEAQALYARDRDIAAKEAYFKSNGQATPQERQQLRADLSALSADVERMMANNVYSTPRDVYNAPRDVGTPGLDMQQYRISQRIDEGVRDGRISRREARRLHTRERALAQREASFKSDGVVTPQERRQLRNDLRDLRDQVERAIRNGNNGRSRDRDRD